MTYKPSSGNGIRKMPSATSHAPSALQCSPESGETAYAVAFDEVALGVDQHASSTMAGRSRSTPMSADA